jgi:hypothetical protein
MARSLCLCATVAVVLVAGFAFATTSASATAGSATLGVSIAGFDDPAGMVLDQQGTLWVANNQAGSVQPVPMGTQLQSQLPAATTGLSYPADDAINSLGDVFVSEQGSTTVAEIPGDGLPGATEVFRGFKNPAEVAVDESGNVWVANNGLDTIQEIPAGATASSTLPAPISGFDHPNGITVDSQGNLWVANEGGSTIQEVPAGSTSLTTLPAAIGGFDNPYAIAIDADGNLWVTNSGNNTVQMVPAGATSGTVLPTAIGGFNLPTDLTIDPQGNIWVSNTGGTTIQEVPAGSTSSSTLPAALGGFNGPFDIVFTSACNAWVSNVGQSFNGSGLTIQLVSAPYGCPTAPVDVTAHPGDGQALVQWNQPSDNGGSAVTGYNVTALPGGASCATLGATFTSCTVTGLLNGASYAFSVEAINAAGESFYAQSATVVPGDVPGAPVDVVASPGNGSAAVSWVPPADHGGPITSYAIEVFRGATHVSTRNDATSPTVLRNLKNGSTYRFVVTASNETGTSAGAAASATPSTVPGVVRSFAAAEVTRGIELKWTAPASDGGATLTGYNVYVGTKPSGLSASPLNKRPLSPGATGLLITALKPGATYYFSVRAINRRGLGARSHLVHATEG